MRGPVQAWSTDVDLSACCTTLWDPVTGYPVGRPLTGHTRGVEAVAAVPLPDGCTLLATGSGDHTVRLWDPVTRHSSR